jgi:sulfite exporter TauE/SafE
MIAVLVASAFLMGLLGSTHCIVMCGGVVAATCSALPLDRGARWRAHLPLLLSYNGGRIASYAVAGAIGGAIGASVASVGVVERAQVDLRFVAGVLIVAVGLYVAGFRRAMGWIERAGEPAWRRIAQVARRFVPVRSPMQALALGLLWGWMPCGLVYASLAGAILSGSALGGALTMAAFGLGTLPMLLAMGFAASAVARTARVRWVRGLAGLVLVLLGTTQTARAWATLNVVKGAGVHVCCSGHR